MLGLQREALTSTNEMAQETHADLDRGRGLIRTMLRRTAVKKAALVVIVLCLLGVICILIAVKLGKRGHKQL